MRRALHLLRVAWLRNRAVDFVARIPAPVKTKLLVAFLAIVALLVVLGAVGLGALRDADQRTDDLIRLQRKIAAYRQVQQDTTTQLYGVTAALLQFNDRALSTALRQLNRFGYDLERLQFIAKDETALTGQVRETYDRFVGVVTKVVDLIRAGHVAEAREMQGAQAGPLADRLERLTNQLVNRAEADMVAGIATSRQSYTTSKLVVIAFACGSVLLALALGYIISRSLVGPITEIEARLRKVAASDLASRVHIANRDELGALAANVNRMSEALEARTREGQEALEQQIATTEVLQVINASPGDLAPVFDAMLATAARLCSAEMGMIASREGKVVATLAFSPEFDAVVRNITFEPGRGTVTGRALLERRVVHVADLTTDHEYPFPEVIAIGKMRTALGVPLLRETEPLGVIYLARRWVEPFTERQIELIRTFAAQAVIAMENARLITETREALEYQTATAEVLGVISRSPTALEPVLDAICGIAAQLCEAEWAVCFQLQDSRYHLAGSNSAKPELVTYYAEHPIPPGRGTLVGRVALDRCTTHIPDCLADPDYTALDFQRLGEFRTMLGVPLLRGGVAIGAIGLARNTVKPFTDKQIKLVETFADQSLIAIENTRLFEEVQARTRELDRSVQELQALAEVGRAISSTLELKVVLKTIVDRAVDLAGCDAGSIFHYHADTGTFALGETTGLDDEVIARLRQLDISARETGQGEAITTRLPLQLPDLSKRPSYPLRDAAIEAGLRAALIVPLIGAEGPLGTLVLQRRVEGEFPLAIVNLMQTFADQSVIALQNARLFEEIARQRHALELASQHKSQFLANTSHELRTPLNAILGYTELVLDDIYGEVPGKIRAVLERVQSNGRHLLALINDVLDLSKIEAGQLVLSIDGYSMKQVVQTVMSATEALSAERGLTLAAIIPDNLPFADGDERRITQVLLNLVGNAIKFTDTGGISIEVGSDQTTFQVAVADTGPGIALADQQAVFEEFRQLDNSSTRTKGGTGLGLAIAKKIIELHGGRIWVESEPGRGACFRFTLPVRVLAASSS